LSGDIFVAASGGGGPFACSVYVFRRAGTSWAQAQRLVDNAGCDNGFGAQGSVDVAGNNIIVTTRSGLLTPNQVTVTSGAILRLNADQTFNNLKINPDGVLTSDVARTMTLLGNGNALEVAGTIDANNPINLNFAGTVAQSATGNFNCNNLLINNTAGVILNGNVTVNNSLQLTSGDLNTGAFTLTMPGAATASDDALADFNNDGLPELAVGRLPARTSAQAETNRWFTAEGGGQTLRR
jgi:hypothetical protein